MVAIYPRFLPQDPKFPYLCGRQAIHVYMTDSSAEGHLAALRQQEDNIFSRFKDQDSAGLMAAGLTLQPGDSIHPLCEIAVASLQDHLSRQNEWQHNFGLDDQGSGAVIGKMFGVLVVRTQDGTLGYLSAFSGKLANGNLHHKFVPPIYDALSAGSFLNTGMRHLSAINAEIAALDAELHHSAILRLSIP